MVFAPLPIAPLRIAPMRLALVVALGILAGCETLPRSAYVGNDLLGNLNPGAPADDAAVPVGANGVEEPCWYSAGRLDDVDVGAVRSVSVRCGTWTQPSARIFQLPGGGSDPNRLALLSTGGAWRTYLDQRVNCEPAATTVILGDVPASLMQCRRRNGGWPHLALATSLDGKTFVADGVLTTLPAIEATLAALGNRAPAPSGEAKKSAAYELLAAKLSTQAFGSGDLDRYYGLMRLGDQYNSVENFAAAEDAFRDALAVQQRILGPSDPSSAVPMMKLAAQISNQGRFIEADRFLAQAAELSQRSTDGLVRAELAFYRASHAANQKKRAEAIELASAAKRLYDNLLADRARATGARTVPVGGAKGLNRALGQGDEIFVNPEARSAILGLAETLRLQSILQNRLGHYEDSVTAATAARDLLQSNGINPPGSVPRLMRITAQSTASAGNRDDAANWLENSRRLFQRSVPNERPVAVTTLIAAENLFKQGRREEGLQAFREGARLLRDRRTGAPDALVSPYLDALFETAEKATGERAALHREMFEVAQLAQGGITAQFIVKAAARLASGDQAASGALRKLQELELRLRALFAERDVEAQRAAELRRPELLAEIDRQIAAAELERGEAELSVQAAAPAYKQLIQTGAPAEMVAAALQPKEAFVSIYLGEAKSFGFLVTPGGTAAWRIERTLEDVSAIVAQLRRSSEAQLTDGKMRVPVYDVAAAHRLYADLLGPIAPRLAGYEALVIAANGPLLSFPFAALLTEPSAPTESYRDLPWLLRKFALSYVPIPQTFVALRQIKTASTASRPFLGFADFRPARPEQLAAAFPGERCAPDNALLARLADLPGTREEVIRIAGKLGAGRNDVILGPDFTRARLEGLDFSRYRIVHFATHAFLPTEIRCLGEPSLLLSVPEGAPSAAEAFLQPDAILKIRLNADLVVLSACNTAGPDGKGAGESLSGLARTFFFAGTRGLLATHWSVSDEAAQRVMTETLGSIGSDTATSLRDSQLRLLDAAGRDGIPAELAHPFGWAPFVLIGDGFRRHGPTV